MDIQTSSIHIVLQWPQNTRIDNLQIDLGHSNNQRPRLTDKNHRLANIGWRFKNSKHPLCNCHR